MDLTIASDIRTLTKPHISEYSLFRLLLSIKARNFCGTESYVPVILSMEYTIGVKERRHSRQGWRYFYFFSFSAVPRDFTYV